LNKQTNKKQKTSNENLNKQPNNKKEKTSNEIIFLSLACCVSLPFLHTFFNGFYTLPYLSILFFNFSFLHFSVISSHSTIFSSLNYCMLTLNLHRKIQIYVVVGFRWKMQHPSSWSVVGSL